MSQHLRRSTIAIAALVTMSACASGADERSGAGGTASAGDDGVPTFAYDPTFPKLPLPNQWIFGELGGVGVGPGGEVWLAHRPWTVFGRELGAVTGEAECCRPAPSIIALDANGQVTASWPELRQFTAAPGTPLGQTYPVVGKNGAQLWESAPGAYGDWGRREHSVVADAENNVWVVIDESHVIYKFTRDGRHLMTIGAFGERGDSNDPKRLGRPTGVAVDLTANELFVSDGYDNRRVIVFDTETGLYKRHWGAYGSRPDDSPMPPYDPTAPPAKQFSTMHGIWLAPDGLVYAADRANNRIQVFQKDGTFIREAFIARETTDIGSAYGVAVSPDNQWVYVNAADTIWILNRETLQVAGRFGSQGRHGGQFLSAHSMTVDGEGNIYVAESRGRRVQRFRLVQ